MDRTFKEAVGSKVLKLGLFVTLFSLFPSLAAQVTDGSQYYVLLIITDGVISDMLQTKEAIVSVSQPCGSSPGNKKRNRVKVWGIKAH